MLVIDDHPLVLLYAVGVFVACGVGVRVVESVDRLGRPDLNVKADAGGLVETESSTRSV